MTTRTLTMTTVCFCIATLPILAQMPSNNMSIFSHNGNDSSVTQTELQSVDTKAISFSIRLGLHDWKDSENVDKNYGAQLEARVAMGDTPLDIDIRGHYADVEYDDYVFYGTDSFRYYNARVHRQVAISVFDDQRQVYGGSAQLLWNFRRGETLNPYVAAGVMYEKDEEEYDWSMLVANRMTLSYLSTGWNDVQSGREKKSDNGTAFVGRVGLEAESDPLYGRIEVAYVSEMYEDDAQAEINALFGVKASENVRIDISGNYFTKWKEYFIMAGVTFLL